MTSMHIEIADRQVGQFFLRTGKVNREELEHALCIQKDYPFLRLGEILLSMQAISLRDLTEALYVQFKEALLGNILVNLGDVERRQIDEALEIQANAREHRLLGAILLDLGHIGQAQLDVAVAKRDQVRDYQFVIAHSFYIDQASDFLLREAKALDSETSSRRES